MHHKALSMFFTAALILLTPSAVLPLGYRIILSQDDNICQHMLSIYNNGTKKYGHINYDSYEEFNWIRWNTLTFYYFDRYHQHNKTTSKISAFDITNNGTTKAVVHEIGSISNRPQDYYTVFNYEDLPEENEIVDGKEYQKKSIFSISSIDPIGIPVDKINSVTTKIRSAKMRRYIIAARQNNDRVVYFVGMNKVIKFLKYDRNYYVILEGPPPIGPGELPSTVEKYSTIWKHSNHNTKECICIYEVRQ